MDDYSQLFMITTIATEHSHKRIQPTSFFQDDKLDFLSHNVVRNFIKPYIYKLTDFKRRYPVKRYPQNADYIKQKTFELKEFKELIWL